MGMLVLMAALALAAGDGPSRPDLRIKELSDPPRSARPGDRLTIHDATVNVGRRRAASSETRYSLGRRLRLGARPVPALRKGAWSEGRAMLRIPRTARDGTYQLTACADARDRVRERDERNNCRSSQTTVVIDTTAPAAPRLDAHPAHASNDESPSFAFSNAEAGVEYACRLDDARFAPCTSPHRVGELLEGAHRFEVRARDAYGNESAATRFDWVVDFTPPAAPSIDERPESVTEGARARVAFSAAEPAITFLCALDGATPASCSSPLELTGLKSGDHTLRVSARDAAGNESEASTVEWTAIPEQTSLGDGAWSWFADPRAVHHRGRTYVGWVAQDGDIKVSAYDHATLARTTALVASRVQVDDHANPAVQILPDGRVRAFYSAHGGMRMWYRTSLAPEDITAWGPAQTMPENSTGAFGFTYPNPVHLAAEGRTYLFWRGGDFNPTFTSQADGSDAWAPVRRLISVAGERPYVKYDSDGESTIHIAFTNAHPNESGDVNIYYAAYRDGAFRRADGTVIGPLGTAIVPDTDDRVFDAPQNAWIHDVAHDDQGRPVLVFAVFDSTPVPRRFDHRYLYARWTGERWETKPITAAGGSISEDPREPYYSGGITLDHEDPRTVYLSRQTGEGLWDVETWSTTDGGDSWRSEPVTAGSGTKNVRPVSPRGMLPFSGDMSVLWMRGRYPYYLTYQTSIATILRTGGDEPPVADAAPIPRRGLAPLAVAFDGRASHDTEGPIADHRWDFGDGASASGAQAEHTYTRPGRYFPKLTVTDAAGRSDTYVTEVAVDAGMATGPALDLAGGTATLTGAVAPREAATAHFEYGTDDFTHRTPDVATGDDIEAGIDGLSARNEVPVPAGGDDPERDDRR